MQSLTTLFKHLLDTHEPTRTLLLGLDLNQLSWYHNGLDRRLKHVHGHVIKEIIA